MTQPSPHARFREGALVGGLLLVALGLRLWRLAEPSLWWDEGVSVYLAHAGLAALTTAKDFSVDLHAPGYHLLLALWSRLAGLSVFGSRLLSVFCGVLTVPLTLAFVKSLSRKTGDPGAQTALVAAILAATSPIDLYYSQEIRMYALLPAVGLLSLLATQRVLRARPVQLIQEELPTGQRAGVAQRVPRRGSWADWALWAVANALGWYCYYYLVFLTIAEAFVLLAAHPRSWRRWLAANVGLLLSYAPWVALVLSRARGSALALPPETEVHLSPFQLLSETGRAFTLGFTSPPGAPILLIVWALLAAAGLLWLARRLPITANLLALALLVSLAGSAAVLAFRPFYYPRFIMFAAVVVWALVAFAASWPRGRWLWLALVPILAGSLWTWQHERTTPRTGYAPDDYRVVFQTVETAAQPGDVVVGGYPWQAGYVESYLGARGVRGIFSSSADAGATADAVLSAAPRAWTYSYSPDHSFAGDKVADAFAARRPTLFVDQFGDTRLRLFGQSPPPPASVSPIQATLGSAIQLVRGELGVASTVRPGDSVSVVLRWQAAATPSADYIVFVHLLGPDGKVWGQKDAPPLGGAFPTTGWRAGEVLVDRYAIAVDSAAPPGQYQVEAGMYLPSTGERLPVVARGATDNRVVLGTFEIRR